MIKMKILTTSDLEYIMDILHDSVVKKEDIKFNQKNSSLDIIFYRIAYDEESLIIKKKFLFIFSYYIYPIAKSILHLKNIAYYDTKTFEDTQKFYFNCTEAKESIYIFHFDPTLEIKFSFRDKIKGYFEDIEVLSPAEARKLKIFASKYFQFFGKII